jgi:predicted acetyltransferase
MSESVSLAPVGAGQWPVVERLWQLYRHDLSEFRGSMPGDDGLFTPGRLPTYVDDPDPDRCGYLIRSGPAVAGFVLVRGLTAEPRTLVEFFVVRAARRRGVGHAAATQVLRAHPGRWEIAFQEENPTAARFWRRFAVDLVGSVYREERRPVPGKPHIPPDTWLLLTV